MVERREDVCSCSRSRRVASSPSISGMKQSIKNEVVLDSASQLDGCVAAARVVDAKVFSTDVVSNAFASEFVVNHH